MNKKILVVSILVVFTLIAISFASAINTTTPVKKKESPLYGIRTRRSIGERLGEIIENIKTRFLGDRIFYLPFQRIRAIISEDWTIASPPTFCPASETCRMGLPCK